MFKAIATAFSSPSTALSSSAISSANASPSSQSIDETVQKFANSLKRELLTQTRWCAACKTYKPLTDFYNKSYVTAGARINPQQRNKNCRDCNPPSKRKSESDSDDDFIEEDIESDGDEEFVPESDNKRKMVDLSESSDDLSDSEDFEEMDFDGAEDDFDDIDPETVWCVGDSFTTSGGFSAKVIRVRDHPTHPHLIHYRTTGRTTDHLFWANLPHCYADEDWDFYEEDWIEVS